MNDKLTPEQIENWRETLFNYLGPFALVMPAYQIEAFREKLANDMRALWPEKPITKKKYKR